MANRQELTRDQIHEAFNRKFGYFPNDDAVSACPHWQQGQMLTHVGWQDMLDACLNWIECNEGDY